MKKPIEMPAGLLFSRRKAIADKLGVPMDETFNAIVRETCVALDRLYAAPSHEPQIIDSPETGWPSRIINGKHVPCTHDGRVHPSELSAEQQGAEPWGYATKAFGWGLVSKQVYESILASHGPEWAVQLYTATPPAGPSEREHDAVATLIEDGWLWDGDQWQRPPAKQQWAEPVPFNPENILYMLAEALLTAPPADSAKALPSESAAAEAARDMTPPRSKGCENYAALSREVVEAILAERKRQMTEEGRWPQGDRAYRYNELARAASVYANPDVWDVLGAGPMGWPWKAESYKPSTRRRDLIKAGALIVAQLERDHREQEGDMGDYKPFVVKEPQ